MPMGRLAAVLGTSLVLYAGAVALPADPPIPGIPGQKEQLPPTVPFALREEPGGPVITGGGLAVKVTLAPFAFHVTRERDGARILRTARSWKWTGFAPIAFTQDHGFTWNTFYWGYRGYLSLNEPWVHAVKAAGYEQHEDRVYFTVETYRPSRGHILFVVGPFYNGAVRLAASVTPGKGTFGRVAFTFHAPENEHYAGFGERFNGVDQRGKKLENWAEEGGIEPGLLRRFWPWRPPEHTIPGGEDASYAPMPFFLSSRGYGLLADVPEPTHFDMAKSCKDMWRVEVEADQLALVVFAGPTPAKALEQYTERTGRVQIPRPWVFGPWNMLGGYKQGGNLKIARIFREKDIPSSVAPDWAAILPVPSYQGREDRLRSMNQALHDLGFKSLCYLQPRVDKKKHAQLWQEGAALGHFVRTPEGDPYVLHVFVNVVQRHTYDISLVDYTHDGVDAWWRQRLQKLVDLGFDGTMYDFGEYVPPDTRFADGHDGHYWHNPYSLIYLRSAFRFFQQLDDDPNDGLAPDYVYFHRSGYAGSQNWAWAMWSGDPEADWSVSDGLPAQVCAGINVGLSGIPFWGTDTGGFHAILVPAPASELMKRWIQFSTFCGLMRDMNNEEFRGGKRIRILDEPELTHIARRYQKLRTQLVPYILNAAREAHETGLPLMRAAFLHFPDDPACWRLKREYLFGNDLYVAPVVEKGARQRTLYLPPGQWIPLWERTEYDPETGGFRIGGVPVAGGREVSVEAPIDEIPVFVRLGAVIPVADPRIDTWAPARPPEGVEVTTAKDLAHALHVWAFPNGRSATTLADGSRLELDTTETGVTLTRAAQPDQAELVAQVVWPAELPPPQEVGGLERVLDADPLALAPGAWTWHAGRRAVALHGKPGQTRFAITCAQSAK